jgi:hypothetical protein
MSIININEYKMDLLTDVFNNPKIVEALDSQQTDIIKDEPDSLIYRNLFPYLRIPDTQNKADTYVLLAVDIDRINNSNKTYAIYKVSFWVLAHMDRMQIEGYNSTRIDFIAQELDRMFDGQQKFGFSEFELISNREIILNEKYHYRELIFICNDLRHVVTMTGRELSGR